MKKSKLILLFCGVLLFASCGSDNDSFLDLQQQQEDLYDQYVSAEIQAAIDEYQIPVNRGINPPRVEGCYRISPMTMLTSSYSSDRSWIGKTWRMDFKMRFFNQKELLVDVLGYEIYANTDRVNSEHSGTGTFISGSGDKFSVFVRLDVVSPDDRYHGEGLTIISGSMERNGAGELTGNIVDIVYVTLFTNMDGNPNWVSDNTTRIFDGTVTVLTLSEFETLTKSMVKMQPLWVLPLETVSVEN